MDTAERAERGRKFLTETLGPDRAARYLSKFYPWYLERLGADTATAAAFQRSDDLSEARQLVDQLTDRVAALG